MKDIPIWHPFIKTSVFQKNSSSNYICGFSKRDTSLVEICRSLEIADILSVKHIGNLWIFLNGLQFVPSETILFDDFLVESFTSYTPLLLSNISLNQATHPQLLHTTFFYLYVSPYFDGNSLKVQSLQELYEKWYKRNPHKTEKTRFLKGFNM